MYTFTFNLVHVPTSQVVWSRVGEVRKRQLGTPSAAMEVALTQLARDLGPDQVRTGRREKRGLLTVLDLSAAGSTPSRIMAERVATHLYASRNYDIMGRKEMEELLAALDINKAELVPSDSGIYKLGGKMDVTHLVYSRLVTATRDGGIAAPPRALRHRQPQENPRMAIPSHHGIPHAPGVRRQILHRAYSSCRNTRPGPGRLSARNHGPGREPA